MRVLNTLHKNWLPSLIFSPSGRDKSEGAGCENPFSTALYVTDVVEESKDVARQAGAALGKIPRLAAKVAAPSRRSSPNGCKGRQSRIARLGKQRDEVR
jgi:hypothetical protein